MTDVPAGQPSAAERELRERYDDAQRKMNRHVDKQILMLVRCGYRGLIAIETWIDSETDPLRLELKSAVFMGEMIGSPIFGHQFRSVVVDDKMAEKIEAMAKELGYD